MIFNFFTTVKSMGLKAGEERKKAPNTRKFLNIRAFKEDNIQRPKLHGFLRKLQQEMYSKGKNVSYESLQKMFCTALETLTTRERSIIFDDLVANLPESENSGRKKLSRATIRTYKQRGKEKIKRFIVQNLGQKSGFSKKRDDPARGGKR